MPQSRCPLTLAPKFTLHISPAIHPHLLELIPIHVAIAAVRPGATIIPVARTLALDRRHAAVHTQGVPAVCNAALAVIHTMIVVGELLGAGSAGKNGDRSHVSRPPDSSCDDCRGGCESEDEDAGVGELHFGCSWLRQHAME